MHGDSSDINIFLSAQFDMTDIEQFKIPHFEQIGLFFFFHISGSDW